MPPWWAKLEKALEQREDRLHAALHHVLVGLDADWLRAQIRARAGQSCARLRFADGARWLMLKDTLAWTTRPASPRWSPP
ncbi:MAG: hypothetical protein U0802_15845 [Candidatus Binatia bacterium]